MLVMIKGLLLHTIKSVVDAALESMEARKSTWSFSLK